MTEIMDHTEQPKVLEYRKHVKFVYISMKYFVLCLFLIFIYYTSLYFFHNLTGSKTSAEELQTTISSALFWLIMYLEYFFLVRHKLTNKILVFQDRIIIQGSKKEIIIPFNEILQVQGTFQKHLGGWFKLILKDGKRHCKRAYNIILKSRSKRLNSKVLYTAK